MRPRVIVTTALAVVLGLPILACEEEPFTEDKHKPKAPAADAPECSTDEVPADRPNLGDKRYVVIYACVEQAFVPMEVMAYVRDHTTGERVDHRDPIAGRTYTLIIGYDKGHDVRMDLELRPSRAGSRQGFLYVSDGKANRKVHRIDGAWRVGPIQFRTGR